MANSRCTHCPGSHTGERPCLASATVRPRAWLLIEHPGPWPERIADASGFAGLPSPIAAAIRAADQAGVRPQLIRRAGRRRATPPFQVFAAWSGLNSFRPPTSAVRTSLGLLGPWLEGRELTDPAELAGLDMRALAAGRRPGFGSLLTERLLLVCTHGRRNACCARAGAPLARTLTDRFGAAVWETTHVGGDRYAANLVCLPHGLYYGDLDAAEAVAAATAYERGEIRLKRFRGRAGIPESAQAAEHFLRLHAGAAGVDDVVVESVTPGPVPETILRHDTARYRIRVRRSAAHGCGPECEESAWSYVLTDLTLLNGTALV